MIVAEMNNRQLALTLAVQSYGDHARRQPRDVERLADKFYSYLETGVMSR